MTIVLMYFFITVPYIKAFFRVCDRPLYNQVYYIYPVYTICTFDIIVRFFTGYVSNEDNGVVIDPGLIARHYAQSFFLIDVISSIPYTWFFEDDLITLKRNYQRNFLAFIGELLPLLKLCRLTTLRYYVKQINAACGFSNVSDISIWLSILTILIFHWSACLTWAFPFIVIHATPLQTIKSSNVYAIQSGLYQNDSTWIIYIISLHMGISNLIGSSFIELQKISPADKLIRCILLLFGSGYTVYLIVVVLQLIESSSEPKLKYQDIKRQVKEYIYKNNIPQELGNKFYLYNQYRFQGYYFKENTIISSLPNHLKQEIYIRSNNGLLESAKIFNNLSKSLISNIMIVMKPIIYLKDEVIYKYNTEGDCMYLIASGTVAIINSMGKELHYHLEDGDHFGERCLINPQNSRREVSAVAVETCELLRLHRRHFNRLILPTSELYKKLSEIADDRTVEIERLNKLSTEEIRMRKRRSSELRRFLMRTDDLMIDSS
ncbi:potassium/sodium hyperpolarization-activated cyclic nucleotide-gated channel 1-like isoform X2 [Microplitis mediator]|nr:potassium/sodium hyperpolarization-activated cyclic nucleotide-gated channel 1-like isoform X2 [Microplitis mediator]